MPSAFVSPGLWTAMPNVPQFEKHDAPSAGAVGGGNVERAHERAGRAR